MPVRVLKCKVSEQRDSVTYYLRSSQYAATIKWPQNVIGRYEHQIYWELTAFKLQFCKKILI